MKTLSTLLISLLATTVVNAKSNLNIPKIEDISHFTLATAEANKQPNMKDSNRMLELWKTLDTDGNNYLSKDEAIVDTNVSSNWHQLDTNNDNKIDFIEFSEMSDQNI